MIEHIFDLLGRHAITEVYVDAHYLADVVLKAHREESCINGLSVHFGRKEELAGPAGGLGTDPVLVDSRTLRTEQVLEKGSRAPGATLQYSPGCKQEAVRLVRSSSDRPILQVAKELGISDSSLGNWIYQWHIVEVRTQPCTRAVRPAVVSAP
jgi:hypothetical protein